MRNKDVKRRKGGKRESKIVLRNVTHQSQLDESTNCDRGEND